MKHVHSNYSVVTRKKKNGNIIMINLNNSQDANICSDLSKA